MSELLQSLKADLLSRRMLPLLVLAVVGLFAAAGYAMLGGTASSSTTPPTGASTPTASIPPVEGPSVSVAPPNPHAALAETTSGGYYQHSGKMHNPFKPLEGSEASSGSKESGGGEGGSKGSGEEGGEGSSGGEGGSTGGGEGSSGGSGGEEGGSTGGEVTPGGTTGEEGVPSTVPLYTVSATLTRIDEEGKPLSKPQTFTEMVPVKPLPSKKKPLLAFLGVAKGGEKAVFLLVAPAILHGKAKCVPSPGNCEGIELAANQSEELQYLDANGDVIAYELKVTKLTKSSTTGSAAAAKASTGTGGKAASKLIAKLHLTDSVALIAAASEAAPGATPEAASEVTPE